MCGRKLTPGGTKQDIQSAQRSARFNVDAAPPRYFLPHGA